MILGCTWKISSLPASVLFNTQPGSYENFIGSTLVYDAVLRNIEIVGEAVKQIPARVQKQYPEVDWRRIAGMRDIVAHHYFSIPDEIVWDIVENKIPELAENVKRILQNFISDSDF